MKKFFAKIHLWLSIPFGIIIAIVCLTGAILVFETEILELCYPSRYFVKEVKGEMLSPAVLMGAAGQQLPDSIKINGIRVSSDPKRTYQLILPGKKAACFINPYTGEITGIDDGKGFFMKIMRLHRWLLDEYKRDGSFAWGKTIVGYSTLVLAIIIISGLVIWYPRNRKALKNRFKIRTKAGWFRFLYDLHVSGGFYAALLLLILALTGLTWSFGWYRDAFYTAFGISTTSKQTHAPTSAVPQKTAGERGSKKHPKTDYTLAIIIISGLVIWYPRNRKALKNRFKIRTKAGWFRFLYDLHVSGGFYAALLLLILALTGLTWSFGWYRDAFYTAFGISTTSKQTHAPTSAVPQKTAGERGSKKHPKTDYTQWSEVLADLQSRYPEYKSISIQDGSATVSTAAYGNTRGSDRYSFDPATGKITEIQLYKDLPKSAKIRGWIYSVHAGTWGGLTTRILSCLVSLLGAVFAITGYYFWIKKKLQKSKQR